MRIVDIPVAEIYYPAAKKKTLDEEKVVELAEDILENGLQKPIYVRRAKAAMCCKRVCTGLKR